MKNSEEKKFIIAFLILAILTVSLFFYEKNKDTGNNNLKQISLFFVFSIISIWGLIDSIIDLIRKNRNPNTGPNN